MVGDISQPLPSDSIEAAQQGALALMRNGRVQDALSLLSNLPVDLRQHQAVLRLRAIGFTQCGQLNQALAVIESALEKTDREHASIALAAKIAFDAESFDKAFTYYAEVLAAQPDKVQFWAALFDAAAKANRLDDALQLLNSAGLIVDASESIELALRVDSALKRLRRPTDALSFARRVIDNYPLHPTARRIYIRRSIEIAPATSEPELFARFNASRDLLSAELVDAALAVPEIFASHQQVLAWRRRLLGEIVALTQRVTAGAEAGTHANDVPLTLLSRMPFFAAYHGMNDLPLARAWGAFVEAVLARQGSSVRTIPAGAARPSRSRSSMNRRKRIAVVSAHLRECTVGNYFAAWFDALTEGPFEINLYSIGKQDHFTARLAQRATKHLHFSNGMAHYAAVAKTLKDDANDIVIYPEVGMEPLLCALAATRLAPVQVAAWGHPVTTGLSNIDYFVSAEATEPVAALDAASHYVEKLVKLPGMGTKFPMPNVPPPVAQSTLEAHAGQLLMLCAQSMFKWSPEFIAVVGHILQARPDVVLVYFAPYRATPPAVFAALLAQIWRPLGVDCLQRTRVLDEMPRQDFLAHIGACDLALDTFGFSGGQTSVDSIAVNLPVVTFPGEFMRGRQTAGMLQTIGLGEWVATDQAHYVEIALRLIDDSEARRDFARRIDQQKSLLFTDDRPTKALVAWLKTLS